MLYRDLVEPGLSAVSLSVPRGHLINGHINNKLADLSIDKAEDTVTL